MNMLCRFLYFPIAIVLTSVITASAQNLPNTTRLLRFPTTNDRDIVFCYAGQLYTVGKDGGTARRLTSGPGYTSFSRFSPDDSKMAFNRIFREFRTWKHYRGGMADDIWIYDFKTGATENLTNNPAQDICPMWGPDNKIYFISDRDNRMNLFVVDLATK